MAIIYSYPTVDPVREDLVLGTDVSSSNKATKNFTIQSIIDLVTVATGDLQTVLALGNVATGFDINLTNSSFIGGGFRTTGGIVISGTTGTGFTNITSTSLTGTVATAAQPNITSLGSLTALVIDGPISGTNLITSSNLAGAQNDNVVSTLAIKTYVDNQVGLFDTLQEVLASGNTTGGTDIAVSASDDITFTDTSKVILGTGADATIEHDGTDLKIINTEGKTTISNSSGDIDISATAATKKTTINGKAGVDLQFDGSKKLETLTGGAKVTGAFEATAAGTFVNLLNSGTYQDSSGDVGTAGQILSSTATGTNWVTEVPLYNWSLEGTAIPSGAAVTVTDGANITTTWDAANYDLSIAVTGLPDGTGAANQVTFWSDTDTLTGAAGFTFAGGATGQVTVAGILQAGTLSDGTFSGSAGTYTGGVSITSTDFVGALTGNADTATALASSGAIAITGDTNSTGGPYTYTSGGAISIATTIADTTVTGKVLTNLATPTSSAIAATDTILAAMAKLQGQITGLAGSLAFEGTWDASTGNPPSATPLNGQFWIVSVAGNTNLDGITDWLVGDWAIYVNNGAGTDAWQKLDQSNEVLGSGAANKIAKWTSTNTLATGLIDDDGTTVTVGNSGNLIVEGNTTLGDADTDSTTVKGPAVFEETSRFNVGISLGAATYGSAGQVLTSGGGAASVNTWTTPTIGVVESISGLYGITVAGTAAIPTVAITADANNLIKLATVKTTPVGADTILINDSAATDVLKQVTLTSLKTFTSENWILSDGTNTTTIADGDTATFAGASGITVAENAGTITITGSAQPGTGTQYTLPVWSTTTSLGDSMVSQNSGGTALTVSGSATFTDDVTIDNSSPELYLTPDAAKYSWMIAAQENIDQHFEITPSTTVGGTTFNAPALKINGSNSAATFAGSVDAGTGIRIKTDTDAVIESIVADKSILFKGTDGATAITALKLNIGDSGDATFNRSIIANNGGQYRLNDTGGVVRGRIRADATDGLQLRASSSNTPTSPERGLDINNDYSLFQGEVIIAGTNPVMEMVRINSTTTAGSTVFKVGDSTNFGNGYKANSEFQGDVDIKGNLTVDGHIIHGGGGGGTGKGGQFTKLYTTGNAGVAGVAFTIDRATTGSMVFDVMLTSDTSTVCAVAKKYTVVCTYGATSPIYNKILDTGPDGSNDFTVAFADDTSNTKIKCTITPTGLGTQKIGITIDLGFGQNDATVVMN